MLKAPLALGFLALVCVAHVVAAQPPDYPQPLPGPLPLFPPTNWWNTDISAAPVDPQSDPYIAFIGGAERGLHPDLGGDVDASDPSNPAIYGMVYVVVSGTQPLVPVTFDYSDESDPGAPGRPPGYPIPPAAITQPRWIEGGYPGDQDQGQDQHMLIVDQDHRFLFETWQTRYDTALNRWEAGSGAVFDLDSNARRPEGWTSADAAGLAILPGLIRYDEAFGSAPIGHAFRVTIHDSNGNYVFPASHGACNDCPANAPPMGTRLRLKANVDLSPYPPYLQAIFQAMKTYGLIVADNGSDMFIQGTYDTRWDNDVMNPAFSSLNAADFEVVQLGWQPTSPPPSKPAAPSLLSAVATLASRVRLNWRDNSTDETSVHVEMRTGKGVFHEVAVEAGSGHSAVIKGLQPRSTHSFRVRAENAAGFSAYSNVATVETP
jgi:hypothetical protein